VLFPISNRQPIQSSYWSEAFIDYQALRVQRICKKLIHILLKSSFLIIKAQIGFVILQPQAYYPTFKMNS